LKFAYNKKKDLLLKEERGISFDEIIFYVQEGYVVDVLVNPNQEKYPQQYIYVIDIEGYLWLVPFIEDNEKIFLKTAFPSRKHTTKYLEEKNVDKPQ